MNKPLTATEIDKSLEPARQWMAAMQAVFIEPLIERTKEILRKRGIEIPKELE